MFVINKLKAWKQRVAKYYIEISALVLVVVVFGVAIITGVIVFREAQSASLERMTVRIEEQNAVIDIQQETTDSQQETIEIQQETIEIQQETIDMLLGANDDAQARATESARISTQSHP